MAEKSSGNIRKEQAEATKRRLIEAAKKAFSEKGYKETAVRALSRSINISESLLYHYFPDGKKELFREILKEELSGVSEKLTQFENDKDMDILPIEEALDRIFTTIASVVSGHIDIIRIVVKESEVRNFISKDDICRLLGSLGDRFEELLKKRIDSGEIKNIDYKTTALTIKALLVNYTLLRILDIDKELLDDPEHRRKMINYYVSLWK
ncbi:TetR/AcrR family transcriptional regulator [Huintestinicola sp.]|uniref:TetR/AcrR family transcriptional regulator n=1 Tax=Huintestinicola sp. TaxID=2981661 RepID=UPI003D7C6933